jgi:large subunit ribosomal protein L4
MKAAALRGALSDRAREGRVHVVETFIEGDLPRTKSAISVLASVTESSKVLVVLSRSDEANWLSLRNLPTVHIIVADQLNTYDVLVAEEVIFTVEALGEFLGMPVTADAEVADAEADAAVADATDESDEEAGQ